MADKDTTQEFKQAEILAAIDARLAASEKRIIEAQENRIAQLEKRLSDKAMKIITRWLGVVKSEAER